MNDATAAVSQEVERTRGDILQFLRELIIAGRQGEEAVQSRVAAEMERLGCRVETVRYRPGEVPMVQEFAGNAAIDEHERVRIIGRFPGREGGRSLILFAHPDGEPISNTSNWRHDPFEGEIENGKLYGWGVADDLAGIAAMVQALRVILSAGLRPAGDIILASTPSKRHARGVSALLHSGVTADAAVYLHPAESGVGMQEVKAFASGQVDFRIVVEGRAPETTEPHQTGFAHSGQNPIDKALLICKALQELDLQRAAQVHHPRLENAVGRSTNLMLSYLEAGDPQRLSRMPSTCTIGAALSFPPFENLAAIQEQIEFVVRTAVEKDEWLRGHPPQILWDSGVTGAEVGEDTSLWQVVADAIKVGTGKTPFVNPMHTSSDIRNPMVQKSIPTVGLGPLCGDLTQNGGVDEWVDVEDYVRSVKVTALILVGWGGQVAPGEGKAI
jgi:acetylornithine deacetylase